jgi:DNA invertase Pin-like site-specific DNA recombinase
MDPVSSPVAFIYDRHTTPDRDALRRRLTASVAYVRDQGWEIGGWYVDSGACALSETERPALERLLLAVQGNSCVERYLVTHDWGRLSNDIGYQGLHARRVRLAGGAICTVVGGENSRGRVSNLVRL